MNLIDYGNWTIVQYSDYLYWSAPGHRTFKYDTIQGHALKKDIIKLYPKARKYTYLSNAIIVGEGHY